MLEQEIKLTAPPTTGATVLDTVLHSAFIRDLTTGGGCDAVRYLGVYYDTDDGALSASGLSLRTRKEGDRHCAALKFGGQIENGLSCRNELEVDLAGDTVSPITRAAQLPDGELKTKVTEIISADAPLAVRVTVDMQRSIRHLTYHGSQIELSADHGIIYGRTREVALYELELELADGAVDDIIALGKMLTRDYDLVPSTMTKHRIGLTLG